MIAGQTLPAVLTTRRWHRAGSTALALAFGMTPAALGASALQTPSCDVSGATLNCRLLGILHFLYGAAGLLGLVLLIVVGMAIQFYRKNQKQPPDDRS